MTDPLVDEKIEAEEEEEDFANLLDSYESALNDDIRVGDKITTEILSIGMDTIFVATGTKIDGAVDKHDLLDENQELPYKVGDSLDLYIVSISENEIRLSKALSGTGGFNQLREAYETNMPIEGKVKEECKGGFNVEIMQQRAFCPISQMDINYIQNPADYVGNTHRFLIIKFEEKGRNIVVSRRKILSMEQEAAIKEFFNDFTVDSIVDGKVTRLMPYGAFVEVFPGLEGMVHISEISWSRLEKVDEILKIGDDVRVKVLSISDGKKPNQYKISLSIKQVDENPWDSKKFSIKVGDRFKGKVKKCLDFGAFVEIASGIEGLVHISEMSYVKRILKPEDVVNVGDEVDVVVKSIEKDNKKISLSMRDAEGDPWIGIKDKFAPEQTVEGTIERKERFGYFISLIPGVTGLLPISVIKKCHKPSKIEKLNIGDKINVIINDINLEERRISFGTTDSNDESEWKQFSAGSKSKNVNGISDLGEQIKNLNLKFE